MLRILLAVSLAASFPQPAFAQLVPEGIHRETEGPDSICGITGSSARDFEGQVKASSKARLNQDTEFYVTYVGPEERTIWAFAKPSNAAFPLATCVRIYEKDGAVYAEREMRCDATRELCDRAFLEFQKLDDQNRLRVQNAMEK